MGGVFADIFWDGDSWGILGNREESLRWFEKAYDDRAGLLVYANVDAVWDDLRSEPRFREIVKKIGTSRTSRGVGPRRLLPT